MVASRRSTMWMRITRLLRLIGRRFSRKWFTALSALLVVTLTVYLWFQPDALAAISLVPIWCWLLPGLLLLLVGARRKHWREGAVVLCLWAVFAAVFIEEPVSVVRGWFQSPPAPAPGSIRIITLNCGQGQQRSVREAFAFKPDILLLQESPSRETVEQLCDEFWGEEGNCIVGSDCAILAKGEILKVHPPTASHFVHAQVQLSGSRKLEVVSLRLAPPAANLDFWTSGFWQQHANVRRKHRQQLQAIPQSTKGLDSPLVIGGDFNCPSHDAATRELRQTHCDAFQHTGQGWGGTGPASYPLFRVDQVYASSKLQVTAAATRKINASDHRAVCCDVQPID